MKANTPATGKKHLKKSGHPVYDDQQVSPSKANSLEEEGSDQDIINPPLSVKESLNVRKGFTQCKSESPLCRSNAGITGPIP